MSTNNKRNGKSSKNGQKRGNMGGNKTTDQLNKMNIPPRKRVASELSDSEDGEDACQLCMNKILVWSIGECNHPICFVCSTRMRVLCQRNECAICRSDLPKVIFTNALSKYEDIKDNIYPMDRKFKICFETEEIQNSYTELLSHKNPITNVVFPTFRQLDQNMRREHEMYYCDLCVKNLNLFTHERKYYNRKDLVRHRREGDPDDSSFKGHPLCEFCDERFFDDEALFKHLRKDHYFCHFCDADGHQYFYAEYPDLRRHFQKDHFLCEEPECEEQKFVVFRTEIDLKSHRLERHGGLMSKSASKEARRVELEFSFNRRDEGGGVGRGRDRGGGRGRGRDYNNRREETPTPEYFDQVDGPVRAAEPVGPVPDLVADFPSLSGAPARAPASASGSKPGQPQSWSNKSGAAAREEEFPSLPGSKLVNSAPQTYKPQPKQAQPSKPKQSTKPTKEEDFPSLPFAAPSSSRNKESKFSKPPSTIKTVPKPQPPPPETKKAPSKSDKSRRYEDSDEDDYPSLSGPSVYLNNSSMKTVKNSGQDLSYSAAQLSSNIRTVKAIQPSNPQSSSNSSKVSINSAFDFPDLAKPSQKLDLDAVGKKSAKKNKNKNNNDGASYASKSQDSGSTERSSLNSICDALGGAVKQVEVKKPTKPEPKVKPVESKAKVAEDDFVRPSKSKPITNNNNIQTKPREKQLQTDDFPTLGKPNNLQTKSKENQVPTDDFPSLGKSKSKTLSNHFASTEEKLVQKKSLFNQWGKNTNQVDQSLQNMHIDQKSPQKKTKNLPPGFGRKPNQNYKYSIPSDFQQRNAGLISTITSLVGGKSLEFKTFKEISGKFRAGQMDSEVYYVECKELLDQQQFNKVFPELLALLPDIKKQQELFQLYRQDAWFDGELVSECTVCQQVNLFRDQNKHIQVHSVDEDFPSL